jgi:hypothetical protein
MKGFLRRVLPNLAMGLLLFALTWFAGLVGSVVLGEVFGIPRVSPPATGASGIHMTLTGPEDQVSGH